MKQSVEMLLKRMGEDKAFAERILSQTEREKVIEIVEEAGIAITLEDIDEANAVIAKALKMQNEGELSEEELENVAGGVTPLIAILAITAVPWITLSVATVVSLTILTNMKK